MRAIAAFVLLYVGIWAVGASVIAIDSEISSVPLGRARHARRRRERTRQRRPRLRHRRPAGSYAALGDVSKVTMIVLMWLGRLEISPSSSSPPATTGASERSPGPGNGAPSRSGGSSAAWARPRGLVAGAKHRRGLDEFRPALPEDGDEARTGGSAMPPAFFPAAGEPPSTCTSTTTRPSFWSSSSCTSPCSGTSCSTRPRMSSSRRPSA